MVFKIFATIAAVFLLIPFFIWFGIKLIRYQNNLPRRAFRWQFWTSFGVSWTIALIFIILAVVYAPSP